MIIPLLSPAKYNGQMLANYRAAGLADMVSAIVGEATSFYGTSASRGRCHDGSIDFGRRGQFVDMQTTCERPAPLTPEDAKALLK